MSIKDKIDARRKAAPAQEPEGSDLAVRIANLERELADARAKLGEAEKTAETWRSKAEQSEGRYAREKMVGALRAAAQKAGAVDDEDVVNLLLPRGPRIDGERVVFGQGADEKSADEFVAAFVESKPHLKRSAPIAQGSGSPSVQPTKAPTEAPVQHDMKTKEGATAAVGGALLKLANKTAKGA